MVSAGSDTSTTTDGDYGSGLEFSQDTAICEISLASNCTNTFLPVSFKSSIVISSGHGCRSLSTSLCVAVTDAKHDSKSIQLNSSDRPYESSPERKYDFSCSCSDLTLFRGRVGCKITPSQKIAKNPKLTYARGLSFCEF